MKTARFSLARLCGAAAAVLLAVVPATAWAQATCRTGFDIGSSGIRVGSTAGGATGRVSIDYLSDVWQGGKIDKTADATAEALRKLAGEHGCVAVAGAYSAWRLAAEQGGTAALADTLDALHRRTGVAVFVMPLSVEGSYGYYAAHRTLGDALTTPFVLDIGGGSVEIASAETGWGAALGQKSWHRVVCNRIKDNTDPDCAANPVGDTAIARAREAMAGTVADARTVLGHGFAVTAVSSPVVRGIHPILNHLAQSDPALAAHVDASGFDHVGLERAIGMLAALDDGALLVRLNGCRGKDGRTICDPRFVGSMITDMLLVDALMDGLGIARLQVAQADLTNVPGILADERAFAWAARYSCYLGRLKRDGIDAYLSDPASCTP